MSQESDVRGRPTVLELKNGAVFAGRSFGADASVAGEVVFDTGMAGHVEALPDLRIPTIVTGHSGDRDRRGA